MRSLLCLPAAILLVSVACVDAPGVASEASEAWHCKNVTVTEADTTADCPSTQTASDRKCFRAEGCGKTAYVMCASTTSSGHRTRLQWTCGAVSPDVKATNGRTYIRWSEAILDSAKKDIPCNRVTAVNFEEGHVAGESWIVQGCGVQLVYVPGPTSPEYTTQLVLAERHKLTDDP
jgi:hypothetical protein